MSYLNSLVRHVVSIGDLKPVAKSAKSFLNWDVFFITAFSIQRAAKIDVPP